MRKTVDRRWTRITANQDKLQELLLLTGANRRPTSTGVDPSSDEKAEVNSQLVSSSEEKRMVGSMATP